MSARNSLRYSCCEMPGGGPYSYSMRTPFVLNKSKTKIQRNTLALLPPHDITYHPPSIFFPHGTTTP